MLSWSDFILIYPRVEPRGWARIYWQPPSITYSCREPMHKSRLCWSSAYDKVRERFSWTSRLFRSCYSWNMIIYGKILIEKSFNKTRLFSSLPNIFYLNILVFNFFLRQVHIWFLNRLVTITDWSIDIRYHLLVILCCLFVLRFVEFKLILQNLHRILENIFRLLVLLNIHQNTSDITFVECNILLIILFLVDC